MTNKIVSLIVVCCFACSQNIEGEQDVKYRMLDYQQVKLYLDTLNAQLRVQADSNGGKYVIPYTELRKGKKQLIFFGTSHVRNFDHPQFAQLMDAFNKLKPEIAFNEGGEVPAYQRYESPYEAVTKHGEIGLLKYLCDSAGVAMINGDMDEKAEMKALRRKVPQDQLYLYLGIERYLNPYKQGYYADTPLDEGWRNEFIPYVKDAGLGLSPEQQSIDTFKALYKRYLGKEFSMDSLAQVHDFYLTDPGIFGDVGRSTKIVRDEALLAKIDSALNKYDRVFIVFGGSHRIAVEPALHDIVEREIVSYIGTLLIR